jgi:hypothetical protein
MRSHLLVMVCRILLAACLAVSLTMFVRGVPAQAAIYGITTSITATLNLTNVIMVLGGEVSLNSINITAGDSTPIDFYINITGSPQGPYTIMGLYQDLQGTVHVTVGLNSTTAYWALDLANSPPNPLDWAQVFLSDTNEGVIITDLKAGKIVERDLLVTAFFQHYVLDTSGYDYFAGLSDALDLVGFSAATEVGSAQITKISTVPLPPSVLLLASGLLGLAVAGRRKRRGK